MDLNKCTILDSMWQGRVHTAAVPCCTFIRSRYLYFSVFILGEEMI